MNIVVCVKISSNGELCPFDAAAYEAALRLPGAEVSLLAMAPASGEAFLSDLTRLGAAHAYLLCDPAFAGSDTLATTYILALALKRLHPDLIYCGRQSLDGDTGQVGPGLACRLKYHFHGGCMSVPTMIPPASLPDFATFADSKRGGESVSVDSSGSGEFPPAVLAVSNRIHSTTIATPAVITFERVVPLRMPSIRSRKKEVTIWTAADLNADVRCCGFNGSPTHVLRSYENNTDYRSCKFIQPSELKDVLEKSLKKEDHDLAMLNFPPLSVEENASKAELLTGGKDDVGNVVLSSESSESSESPAVLDLVLISDAILFPPALLLAKSVKIIPTRGEKELVEYIRDVKPDAVLFTDSPEDKYLASILATLLETGLCADCTKLECGQGTISGENGLIMYRPALGGNVIAKLCCKVKPALATVRVARERGELVLGLGMGAKAYVDAFKEKATALGAEICGSRALVDSGALPYPAQVGLTGRIIAPKVYVACGISGAVHHIAGIKKAGTIIAINPDRFAPIFRYADYGIIATGEKILELL